MASRNAGRTFQKLFVTNLPWTVSHQELRNYFADFGKVISAQVIFDKKTGTSKRYGFVTIHQAALPNIEERQKHSLENHTLIIQKADSM